MWYVIWTTTGREEQCRMLIERDCDHDTYRRVVIPRTQIRKKIRGEWTTVEEKLFPSYLFVQSDRIEDFAIELRDIIGFSVLLKSDELIVPLYPKEEQLIEQLLGGDDKKEVVEPSIGVKEGDMVRILSGPLVNMETMIKRIDRHKQLAFIEVELFNRTVEMKLSLEVLEVLPGQEKPPTSIV